MHISEVLFWGMFGICAEVAYTAIFDLITKKKITLMRYTSLWIFPIYAFGLSYGFDLVETIIQNDIVRYLSYPIWVWMIEILVIPLIKIWNTTLGLQLFKQTKKLERHHQFCSFPYLDFSWNISRIYQTNTDLIIIR